MNMQEAACQESCQFTASNVDCKISATSPDLHEQITKLLARLPPTNEALVLIIPEAAATRHSSKYRPQTTRLRPSSLKFLQQILIACCFNMTFETVPLGGDDCSTTS